MRVHVLSDSIVKLSQVRALLSDACDVTTELLNKPRMHSPRFDAVIAAIDIRRPGSISALKEISDDLACVPKRIFLLDQRSRLALVQSYALGATTVLGTQVRRERLLAEVLGQPVHKMQAPESAGEGVRIAAAAAEYIASMFGAAMRGRPIDIKGAADIGCTIVDRVAEDGLSPWLETVRNHHEGTYQHCLLVAGVSADFGLSLGFGAQDMERLGLAAMLHDIGKANIPLAVLDKRGRLNDEERTLIETHPVIGFDALDNCSGISSEILDVVRHHHEYLDGSGYPDGLCGESISDLTRIVTISDIFSALIERRSYKPTMPREEAFRILSSMQGKLEMPLVSAFRKVALSR
jgi:putative nucleotidyltransferase with HDIG domain